MLYNLYVYIYMRTKIDNNIYYLLNIKIQSNFKTKEK